METTLQPAVNSDLETWDAFVAASPQGALYHLSGFANIVAPDWQMITVKEKGSIVAGMPLVIRKKLQLSYSYQPVFTQFWGPLFAAEAYKNNYTAYSRKAKLLEALIQGIPPGIQLSGWGCSPAFDYATPFHWEGYEISQRSSYRLSIEGDAANLLNGMRDSLRQDIRKATDKLSVISMWDEKVFHDLVRQNHKAGKTVLEPRFIPLLESLGHWLVKENKGFALLVQDARQDIQGAGLFGTYKGTTHYLFGAARPGGDPLALSFLVWNAIQKARESSQVFDFEGSMIKGIENFFRAFGGRPEPYVYLSRNALPLPLKWMRNFS